MASYPTNYGLHQWEATDNFLRTDFNTDFEKIDGALGVLADGQLRITQGTYVGTGGSGSGAPNTLTFPFPPQIVFITVELDQSGNAGTVFFQGQSKSSGMGTHSSGDQLGFQLTWSGNTLSWYNTVRQADDGPSRQFNYNGMTYRYVAVG